MARPSPDTDASVSPDLPQLAPAPSLVRRLLHGLAWWAPLLAVGLAAHGPLLVDDGLYIDDWWMLAWILEGRFWDLIGMTMGMGTLPIGGLLGVFLQLPGPIFIQRLYTLVLLVVSAGLMAKITQASRLATSRQALAIGVLTLVAPAHRALSVVSQAAPTLAMVVMFQTAALVVLRAESLAGPSRRWRRGLALALFWVSFYLSSLLVPYVGLWLLLLAQRWRRNGFGGLRSWLTQHWTFLLLPWVFWGFKLVRIYVLRTETPGYNAIRWDVSGVLLVYEEALRTYALIARGWLRPAFMGLLVAALVVMVALWRRLGPEPVSRRGGIRLAWLGAVFFLLGVFPYAAVGKGLGPPGAHWSSHYALLLSGPLAMLGVGVVVTIWGSLSRAACVVILALLGIWTVDAVSTHLHWQAEAIKWKAVCQQVGRSREVRDASIVAVVDQWPLGVHDSVEGGDMPPTVVMGSRLTRAHFTLGFTPLFDHFCARGARKLAGWVPVPDHAGFLDAARDVLDVLRRAGALPPPELDGLGRALDGDVPVAAMRAVVGAHPATFREGLRRLELENGYRALRSRVYLGLLGLPAGPAVQTRLHEAIVELWGPLANYSIAQPSPSVLVVVKPGAGHRAVPVGHRGWWREARRVWAGYQGARLRGPATVSAFLDRVAVVEVRQLTR